MGWHALLCVILPVLLPMPSVEGQGSRCSHNGGNDQSLHEKALHHYGELAQTLADLQRSDLANLALFLNAVKPTSGSNKANDVMATMTDGKANADLSALILHSLLSNCWSIQNSGSGSSTNINIYNNASIYLTARGKKAKANGGDVESNKDKENSSDNPDTPEIKPYQIDGKKSWFDDVARPLNFTFRREGQATRMTFAVVRTSDVFVSHTWTPEGQRKLARYPNEKGGGPNNPVKSNVDLLLNTSGCPPDLTTGNGRRVDRFMFTDRKSTSDWITFELPGCFLDVINGIEEGLKARWMKGEDEYTHKIQYPDFWKRLDFPTLTAVPGKNTTLDFELDMKSGDFFMTEGIFYNKTNGSIFLASTAHINVFSDKMEESIYVNPMITSKVVFLEILNQTKIGEPEQANESPDIRTASRSENYGIRGYVRLTVANADDNFGGIVTLYHQAGQTFGEGPLRSSDLMKIGLNRLIRITQAGEAEPFPLGKVKVHTKDKFRCGPNGFSTHQGLGDRCTFFCGAVGRGIKHIRIKKVRGPRSKVLQSYLEVNLFNAMLFVDLGPTSQDQDGVYECRIVTTNGKRHRYKVAVRTWGFPTITKNVLKVGDDVSNFTCAATSGGRLPMEVWIALGKEPYPTLTRIDDNPNYTRVVTSDDNVTEVTLIFPTAILKWPRTTINCFTENDAEEISDAWYLHAEDIPNYYANTGHPHILKERSNMAEFMNGTTRVVCVATGKEPLKMEVYRDGQTEEGLMKNVTTDQTKMADGSVVFGFTLPTSFLRWPSYFLTCRVSNALGEFLYSLDLNEHIKSYYQSR